MKKWIPLVLVNFIPAMAQAQGVGIAGFVEDSVRVPVRRLVQDPVVVLFNPGTLELVSYDLALTINGVYHEWHSVHTARFSHEQVELLMQVKDVMPLYNQLFIENVVCRDTQGELSGVEGLYLWLAQVPECTGKFTVDKEHFKHKYQVRYEHLLCDGKVYMVREYRRDGTLRRVRNVEQ